MRKGLLLLIMILMGCRLAAQGLVSDPLSEARKAVAYDPVNDGKRLDLAWNLMLAGQYEEALVHYRLVSSRDSSNTDAATGVLWSLSAQNQHRELIKEADKLISVMPEAGPLYYYRGLARLHQGKANKARTDEKRALRSAPDSFWQDLAARALSDSYLALDDRPAAKSTLNKHAPQAILPPARKALTIELTAGAKGDSTYIIAAGLKASLGTTRLGFKAEELRLGAEHFRWMFQASALQQFHHFDLFAELNWLEGKDAKVYPAKGTRLGLTPKIYAGPLIFRPRLSQSVLITPRLNAYQSDAGLRLSMPALNLSYSLSWIYLDKEIVDADTSDLAHSADASFSFARGWELGIYGGSGALAWHNTPYGGVIDDFTPDLSYAGASIYAPIGKRLGLLLYGQLSFDDSDSTPFYYLRGSYRV